MVSGPVVMGHGGPGQTEMLTASVDLAVREDSEDSDSCHLYQAKR